jgi:hypothetical protein
MKQMFFGAGFASYIMMTVLVIVLKLSSTNGTASAPRILYCGKENKMDPAHTLVDQSYSNGRS